MTKPAEAGREVITKTTMEARPNAASAAPALTDAAVGKEDRGSETIPDPGYQDCPWCGDVLCFTWGRHYRQQPIRGMHWECFIEWREEGRAEEP